MSTSVFVEQLYTNFLGRNSEEAGKAYWINQIDSHVMNATQVTQSFIESTEFTDSVSPITQLYYTAFGRIPDAGGLLYWLQALKSGVSIEEISANFVDSAEYQNLYGDTTNNSDYLEQLYLNTFNRASDTDGKAYWLAAMDNGLSQAEVIKLFADSVEFEALRGDDIKVVLKYHGILGTQPTQAQVDAAVTENTPERLITQLYANSDYSGEPVPELSTNGVVVDGYVSGATVFIDTNGNGLLDDGESSTTTDSLGNFDFGINAGFGSLVMSGGTDISTGQAFEGTMTAPSGSTVVNPLTTLINIISQDGATSVDDATSSVLTLLGLDNTVNLLNYDPIAQATYTNATQDEADIALAIQAAAIQVNTLISQTAALLDGAGVTVGEEDAIYFAYAALAEMLSSATDEVDLSSETVIEQVIQDAATEAGADSTQTEEVETLSTDAAQTIANLNQAIDDAVTSGADIDSTLIKIASIQVVAEDIEADMETGAQSGDVSSTTTSTEGTTLTDAVDDAGSEVGDVTGDGTSDATDGSGDGTTTDGSGGGTTTGGSGGGSGTPSDTTAPIISSVVITDGNLVLAETATVIVTFDSEIVTDATAATTLALDIGGISKLATYASKTSTTMTFTYDIEASLTDTDGIDATADGIVLSGAETITDTSSNTAVLTYTLVHNVNTAVDAIAPVITDVTIPNVTMKTGDTVTATVTATESGLTLGTSTIGGFTLSNLVDNSDNTYSIDFAVTNGGTDVAAGSDIPVNVILTDAAGNQSAAFTTPISQGTDAIDANAPADPVINTISGDDRVNSTEVTAGFNLTGTGEVGATITVTSSQVTFSSGNTTVVDGSGNWSIAIGSNALNISAIPAQGYNSITATQVDLAGNVSGAGNTIIVADVIAPTVTATPTAASATTISLTSDENATAGIYAAGVLVSSSINLITDISNSISVSEQASQTTGAIIVEDAVGNQTTSSSVVLGTSGDDTFSADNTGNLLFGFGGLDILTGGNGDDILVGGTGAVDAYHAGDQLTGGAGNDTFIVDDGRDWIKDLQNGDIFNIYTGQKADIDVIGHFTATTDTIINGNAFMNSANGINIDMSAVTDISVGLNISAFGNALASTLIGTSYRDVLEGGLGNDTLTGGLGIDNLTGGVGADTFVISSGDTGLIEAQADTITDFVTGIDKIDIDSVAGAFYSEVDGALNNEATFLANAEASFNTLDVYIYVEYNANGTGDTWVIIDEIDPTSPLSVSGTVETGDTFIVLTGIGLASEIALADFI